MDRWIMVAIVVTDGERVEVMELVRGARWSDLSRPAKAVVTVSGETVEERAA